MGKPSVEGTHRYQHLVAVLLGVTGDFAVADVPISGPVQVGVVQHEGRLQNRRPARGLGGEPTKKLAKTSIAKHRPGAKRSRKASPCSSSAGATDTIWRGAPRWAPG